MPVNVETGRGDVMSERERHRWQGSASESGGGRFSSPHRSFRSTLVGHARKTQIVCVMGPKVAKWHDQCRTVHRQERARVRMCCAQDEGKGPDICDGSRVI